MRGGGKEKEEKYLVFRTETLITKKIKVHFSVWKPNYSPNTPVLNLNETENISSTPPFLKGPEAHRQYTGWFSSHSQLHCTINGSKILWVHMHSTPLLCEHHTYAADHCKTS